MDGDENGISIDEKEIFKPVDVYGRGKRGKIDKIDDIYVDNPEDHVRPSKSPGKIIGKK